MIEKKPPIEDIVDLVCGIWFANTKSMFVNQRPKLTHPEQVLTSILIRQKKVKQVMFIVKHNNY